MKKTIVFCVLIICLAAIYGYAQMGGGMMDEGRGDLMQGRDMTGMVQLMGQMARMMQHVSSIIRNDLSPGDMQELSEITDEMSDQISEMSRLMETDYYDPGEIRDLQWRMRDTEDRLRAMR